MGGSPEAGSSDEWRVEYFDDDGGCYVTAFAGPTPSKGSADYFHSLKLELALRI
jgi:hypothetical protein